MEFWIGLVFFSLLCMVIGKVLPRHINSIVPLILVSILCFITAFRYMIGWDYESYMTMFYSVELGDFYPEASFIVVSILLRNLGFDYQAIFVFYAVLTFVFLWKGIKVYSKENDVRILALILFLLSPFLYWNSFNGIRQMLAVCIFFWGAQYIISKEFWKYISVVLFASLWHYSAAPLIFLYWICSRRYSKKFYVVLFILSFIISYFGLIDISLRYILTSINMYEVYLDSTAAKSTTNITLIFWCGIFFMGIFYRNLNDDIYNLSINMFFIAILSIFFVSFSGPLYRMRWYFECFYIILFAKIIINVNKRYNTKLFYAIVICLVVIFINSVSIKPQSIGAILHPYLSANNIEYKFNFKLFRE